MCGLQVSHIDDKAMSYADVAKESPHAKPPSSVSHCCVGMQVIHIDVTKGSSCAGLLSVSRCSVGMQVSHIDVTKESPCAKGTIICFH